MTDRKRPTDLAPEGDYITGPGEKADSPEGFTETGFVMSDLPQGLKDAYAATSRLRNEGGRGDGVSDVVDGELLTVRETVALTIARDMLDDALRREPDGTGLQDIPLIKLMDGVDERVRGRSCTAAQVMQEIGRLQNVAAYGDRVPRVR